MARVNPNFCRPVGDGSSYEYAPVAIPPKLGTPTEEDYNAAGWYRKEIDPPEIPEGQMVASVRYFIENNAVHAEYTYEDAPPPIRTFSKLRLYAALASMGKWDSLLEWLQTQTLPNGINAYTAFDQANDLTDEHPLFKQWFASAKTALGIDDETAEAVLDAASI